MSRPARILVVDDSRLVLHWTRDALEDAGHEVEVAEDVFIAPVVRRFEPDLILLDVAMGGHKGTNTAVALRAYNLAGTAKIVLYSGKDEAELQSLVAQCGADGHIRKSDNAETLRKAVRQFLNNASPKDKRPTAP